MGLFDFLRGKPKIKKKRGKYDNIIMELINQDVAYIRHEEYDPKNLTSEELAIYSKAVSVLNKVKAIKENPDKYNEKQQEIADKIVNMPMGELLPKLEDSEPTLTEALQAIIGV